MPEPYEAIKPDTAPPPTEADALSKEFKMTQMGMLPQDWDVVQLHQVTLHTFGGGTPSTKNPAYWSGPIPWTTTAVIGEFDAELRGFQRTISEEGLKSSASTLVPQGSLLIGTRVGVGKAVVTTFDVAINQDLTALVLNERLDARFAAYLLKAERYQRWFRENKRGTTIKGVPRQDVLNLQIPLPPLPEQRAIAHVLRTVQRAKEATEQVIAEARELKKSLMRHLFTYGPVPVEEADKVRLKETEIGPVPEHWEVRAVRTLLREPLKNGHSARETLNPDGVRTLTLSAVTYNDFSPSNTKLTVADPNKVRDLWLKPGDILVERANTIEFVGLSALYKGPENYAIYPDLMIRVRCREEEVIPGYLVEYLRTDRCRKYFRDNASGTAGSMPKISQGVVEQALIPIPSFGEQRRIATTSEQLDDKVRSEQARLASLDALFQSLLHHLMTGKVRVNQIAQSLGVE
ncbi:restriction endonuclease subunit S [Calidithermus chliarophilus]|uniref:restriction endonuclease subunit S n=1 Tax=Calidithermus chliarophilus TaxID=52023 RepID=UPI000421E80F|nr:restriction endonuclease subunit S [Calidithermus chliarophilus]